MSCNGWSGVDDLDDPRLAGLTREPRYRVVLDLAIDNLAAGMPVVLVAPFTAERTDPAAWAAARDRLMAAGGTPLLVWLRLEPAEVLRRLRERDAPGTRPSSPMRPPTSHDWRRRASRPAFPISHSTPPGRPTCWPARSSTHCRPDSVAIDGRGLADSVVPSMAQPRSRGDQEHSARRRRGRRVSLRTASRVLNDDPRVAVDTRARVQQAMRDLKYTPDSMARSLRAGTDTAVGMVVESVADPFFSAMVAAVEKAESTNGKSVLVASTTAMPPANATSWLKCSRGGSAACCWRPPPGTTPGCTPTRHWCWSTAQLPASTPTSSASTTKPPRPDAVHHLVAHGHRRIAYISDHPLVPTSRARLAGYRRAMAAHALDVDPRLVRAECPDAASAAAAARDLLAGNDSDPPTALLSAATRCSLGVVPTLHAIGRTDMALVCFGDFAMADLLQPGITVVDHSAEAVGAAAAARLAERIAQPDLPASIIHVPVRLIPAAPERCRPVIAREPRAASASTWAPRCRKRCCAHHLANNWPSSRVSYTVDHHAGRRHRSPVPSVSSSSPSTCCAAATSEPRPARPLRVSAVAVAGLAESGVVLDGSGASRGLPSSRGSTAAALRRSTRFHCVTTTSGPSSCAAPGCRGTARPASRSCCGSSTAAWSSRPPTGGSACPSTWCIGLAASSCTNRRWHPAPVCSTRPLARPWADGAAELGLPPTLLPARQPFGESVGTLAHTGLPDGLQGAALLVGGHDHPVAAIGVGATGPDELLNSTGTADVVVRSLPAMLTDRAAGTPCRPRYLGRHARAARYEVRSSAASAAACITAPRARAARCDHRGAASSKLDRAALAVGTLPAGLEISGAGPTGDDVVLHLRDDADPATVWAAATRYTARETRVLLDLIESIVGPHTRAVASGGWTRMASVRTAKSAVIDHPDVFRTARAGRRRRRAAGTPGRHLQPRLEGESMSTPSTTRSLADIATPDGVFSIIAMDQRNTLRRMFGAVGIDATDDDLVAAKTDVARALTPLASGILFDPTYGVPAITAPGARARRADCWWHPSRPSAASSGWSRSRAATRRLTRAGCCRRAATPTSSSPSCGPTARHLPPVSRISSRSACGR